MTKQIFVGFADSDKFLAAVDVSRPINLSITRKHGKQDRMGLRLDSTILIMSQAQGSEVLYFECRVHKYQVFMDEIFGSDKEKPSRLADQVQAAAEQYLTERGLAWRDALISIPSNYVTLDGEPTFLKYDKQSESYSFLSKEKEQA